MTGAKRKGQNQADLVVSCSNPNTVGGIQTAMFKKLKLLPVTPKPWGGGESKPPWFPQFNTFCNDSQTLFLKVYSLLT